MYRSIIIYHNSSLALIVASNYIYRIEPEATATKSHHHGICETYKKRVTNTVI